MTTYLFAPYSFQPILGIIVQESVLKQRSSYILLERMLAVLEISHTHISKLVVRRSTHVPNIREPWQPHAVLAFGCEGAEQYTSLYYRVACPKVLQRYPAQKKEVFVTLCQLKEQLVMISES